MSLDRQIALRDELVIKLLDEVKQGRILYGEALAVCMGACAALLGAVPDPADRRATAKALAKALPAHAEKRAHEIHSANLRRLDS